MGLEAHGAGAASVVVMSAADQTDDVMTILGAASAGEIEVQASSRTSAGCEYVAMLRGRPGTGLSISRGIADRLCERGVTRAANARRRE